MNTFNSAFHELNQKLENGDEIDIQAIDFSDKRIVFVKYNGEVDSTFDVQAPDSNSLYDLISCSANSANFSYEKTCLMGDSSNLKLAVLINHIAKLIYTSNETKGLVVSLSSKVFISKDPDSEDFDRLLLIIELIKKLLY